MDGYYEPQKRPSVKAGWIGGLFLGLLLLLPLIPGMEFMDYVVIVLSIPIYFLVGRRAAEGRYDSQRMEPEPLNGVQSTGMAAVFIALAIAVAVLILREVIADLAGNSFLSAASLCWLIPAQFVSALIFGNMSVRIVIKSHSIEEKY